MSICHARTSPAAPGLKSSVNAAKSTTKTKWVGAAVEAVAAVGAAAGEEDAEEAEEVGAAVAAVAAEAVGAAGVVSIRSKNKCSDFHSASEFRPTSFRGKTA